MTEPAFTRKELLSMRVALQLRIDAAVENSERPARPFVTALKKVNDALRPSSSESLVAIGVLLQSRGKAS